MGCHKRRPPPSGTPLSLVESAMDFLDMEAEFVTVEQYVDRLQVCEKCPDRGGSNGQRCKGKSCNIPKQALLKSSTCQLGDRWVEVDAEYATEPE